MDLYSLLMVMIGVVMGVFVGQWLCGMPCILCQWFGKPPWSR